ncbi:MAG: signal peptidase I [Ruminococcus sp.]|nr:signal peptidase I [Ruminococcus sp.]
MSEETDAGIKSRLRSFSDLLETLFITFFVMTMVFTYLVRIVTVNGGSMESTLMPGERLIVSLMDKSPEQRDIVLIDSKESFTLAEDGSLQKGDGIDKIIVKRVIACGGQTVDIDFSTGAVTVDGTRLYEDYLKLGLTHTDEGAFTGKYPVTVPEGYIFVMGDHRSVSKDSRSADIGFVPEDSVIGKVVLRLTPVSRFGTVG